MIDLLDLQTALHKVVVGMEGILDSTSVDRTDENFSNQAGKTRCWACLIFSEFISVYRLKYNEVRKGQRHGKKLQYSANL